MARCHVFSIIGSFLLDYPARKHSSKLFILLRELLFGISHLLNQLVNKIIIATFQTKTSTSRAIYRFLTSRWLRESLTLFILPQSEHHLFSVTACIDLFLLFSFLSFPISQRFDVSLTFLSSCTSQWSVTFKSSVCMKI